MSRLNILKYTENDRKKILEKFEKTEKDIEDDVNTIKEWLKSQAHLPEIPDNDVIERFLVLNKCRIEVTKQKIDGYYSIRSLIPEFYNKNPNGPDICKVMEIVHFIPLPKLTEDFNRVIVIKPRDTNVDKFDVVSYLAHTLNVAEIRLRNDYQNQEIHIYDLTDLKVGHFTKFTPSVIRKASFVVEKVFSFRSMGIHFINAPSFIDSFYTILKNTIPAKLANKIYVHKGAESLYRMFPRDILPKDYGGYERSLDELSNEWKKIFSEYNDLFQYLREIRVNEKLREKPLFNEDDIFGVQGNFKQLTVD